MGQSRKRKQGPAAEHHQAVRSQEQPETPGQEERSKQEDMGPLRHACHRSARAAKQFLSFPRGSSSKEDITSCFHPKGNKTLLNYTNTFWKYLLWDRLREKSRDIQGDEAKTEATRKSYSMTRHMLL